MFIHCGLLIIILVLTLGGQVQTGEIYGGHMAAPHSRPYMVLLEQIEDGTKKHCGGFLLNEEFVMTAAHCQAKSSTALLGVHNVSDNEEIQRIAVVEAFPHQEFNRSEPRINDIMLLKLTSKVNFNKNVKPIALGDRSDGSLPQPCSISGWGITEKTIHHLSPVLMEVDVTLINKEFCAKCMLYCSEGEMGPGGGDSGGPLVCEDEKAYGVVSFNFKPHSGDPKINGYTNIPDHRDWINDIMKRHGKL